MHNVSLQSSKQLSETLKRGWRCADSTAMNGATKKRSIHMESTSGASTNPTVWIQIVILAAQVIAGLTIALLSYFKIYRHRAIYSIKRMSIRAPSFEPSYPESETQREIEGINRQLVSGKYTILQMVARTEYDIDVYMGQVKR